MVEHCIHIAGVIGSNPIPPTRGSKRKSNGASRKGRRPQVPALPTMNQNCQRQHGSWQIINNIMIFEVFLDQLTLNLSQERKISFASKAAKEGAMAKGAGVKLQEELFLEKTIGVFTQNELTQKIERAIENKKPLRIKHGIDPTSKGLHLGHYVVLRKLRVLQKLGHQIIFLVGDFTAMIGDPSDKASERKPLTEEEVKENVKGFKKQIGKFLDLSGQRGLKGVKMVYNSQWLKKMSLNKFLPLTSLITVSQMLERENFAKRFKENKPISIREFLYPFLQGYDSVELEADIEIGGTDQTFNMLVGRQIQEVYHQKPQVVITLPLLLDMQGKKMSKSVGNCIFLADKPTDVFGKIMSISDNLLKDYFLFLTDISFSDWQRIENEMKIGYNPKKIKEVLAQLVTAELYTSEIAITEKEKFNRLFSQKIITSKDVQEIITERPIKLIDLLLEKKIIKSKSQLRRLITEKAIKLIKGNKQTTISNPDYLIKESGSIFKVGKKIFIKVVF